MPKNLMRLFAAILCYVCLLSSADGGLLIDAFTTGTFSDVITSSTSHNHLDSGTVLGGSRRAINTTSGFGNPNATVAVQNGAWSLTGSGGGVQVVALIWGNAPNGSAASNSSDTPLNLNLSAIDSFFEFDVGSFVANGSISLRAWSGVDEGNLVFGSFNSTFPQGITTPQTVQANFNQFSNPALDFTDIDGIALVLDFPTNDDFTITEFRVGQAVPEPTSSALLAFAFVGFLSRRRRRFN